MVFEMLCENFETIDCVQVVKKIVVHYHQKPPGCC